AQIVISKGADPRQGDLTTAQNVLSRGPFQNLKAALATLGKSNLDDCIKLRDNRLLIAFHLDAKSTQPHEHARANCTTFGAYSSDNGKTWGGPFAMKSKDGKDITIPGLGSLLELRSGALGYYYRTSDGREGWGANFQWWRKSIDG